MPMVISSAAGWYRRWTWLVVSLPANERVDGQTDLVQTAYFAPKGLFGLLYWYGIYPLHGLIFSRMIAHIASLADQQAEAQTK